MTTTHTNMIPAEEGVSIGCPACGLSHEACEGHPPSDREGTRILDAHDAHDHTDCVPSGCSKAGTVTEASQPAWVPPVAVTSWTPPGMEAEEPIRISAAYEAAMADAMIDEQVGTYSVETAEPELTPAEAGRALLAMADEEPEVAEAIAVLEEEVAAIHSPAAVEDVYTPVVWEEPEVVAVRASWSGIVAELKANEGKWARVATDSDRKVANRARNALRHHGLTTKSKTVDGVVIVWACFNPKEDA